MPKLWKFPAWRSNSAPGAQGAQGEQAAGSERSHKPRFFEPRLPSWDKCFLKAECAKAQSIHTDSTFEMLKREP